MLKLVLFLLFQTGKVTELKFAGGIAFEKGDFFLLMGVLIGSSTVHVEEVTEQKKPSVFS